MPPSSRFPWQQTGLTSLAQCLSEFGFEKLQDADAHLSLILKQLPEWRKTFDCNNPTEDDYQKFLNDVILMDPRVRVINTAHFRRIQKTHPETTNEHHKQWLGKVWIQWARLKTKMIKRMQTGARRDKGKTNTEEAPKEKNNPEGGSATSALQPSVSVSIPTACEPFPIASASKVDRLTTPPPTEMPPSTPAIGPRLKRLQLASPNSPSPSKRASSPPPSTPTKRQRVTPDYFQSLGIGLREQFITPGDVLNFVNEVVAEWDSQRTKSGEGFGNAEFGTEIALRVQPDTPSTPRRHITHTPSGNCIDTPGNFHNTPSPASTVIDPSSMTGFIAPQITYPTQQMLDIQYHPFPVSSLQRASLSPEPPLNSSPDSITIRHPVSDIQDLVRVRPLGLLSSSRKGHAANSTDKYGFNSNSLSDLNSDDFMSECDNSKEDDLGEDESELESEKQVDRMEPNQMSTGVQKPPIPGKMGEDKELEDNDNAMNTELKALLNDETEDADLEAKVGALESNRDVLDLDIISPQGVDGDDDEDIQYIPPDTNQAPRTPEPEERLDTDGLESQDIDHERLKRDLSLGIEMEHKYLRCEHDPQHEPEILPPNKLHPWQRIGVTFLHKCRERSGYALLADDMGVGKTVQSLSFIQGNNRDILKNLNKDEHKRHANFVVCPVILVSNWIAECPKFFANEVLRTKEWSLEEWNRDTDINTIWIIKESLLDSKTIFTKTIQSQEFRRNVVIHSVFADEAHLAWRSFTSKRSEILRDIQSRSAFNVLISGTMFPLGLWNDARRVLLHIGGALEHGKGGKWDQTLARSFRRLLSHTGEEWDPYIFRALMAQFVLRRTTESTWLGKYVINKTVARPIPFTVLPEEDQFSESANALKKFHKEREHTRESMSKTMSRADKQRFYAWTTVYEEVTKERCNTRDGNSAADVKVYEDCIKKMFKTRVATGRVKRLVSLLKMIKAKGERFIIVSDRLFLLVLAYHICELLNLKMGCLSGTKIWGHSITSATRSATVEALNTGDLDGIVMTDRVGACGHNLVGANHMIFLGSLYSYSAECQSIVGRMCREGQTRVPKAYVIADPQFKGDKTALEIKQSRREDEDFMTAKLNRRQLRSIFSKIERLKLPDDEYDALVKKEWQEKCDRMIADAKAKMAEERNAKAKTDRSIGYTN